MLSNESRRRKAQHLSRVVAARGHWWPPYLARRVHARGRQCATSSAPPSHSRAHTPCRPASRASSLAHLAGGDQRVLPSDPTLSCYKTESPSFHSISLLLSSLRAITIFLDCWLLGFGYGGQGDVLMFRTLCFFIILICS